MNCIKKNKKGEIILETIIAMGILAIGITTASTFLASSIRNMNVSKNRIIAVNIARGGIEAIRNIRDTNWLKFQANIRKCWNHNPATDTCNNTDEPIFPGKYIIYKQEVTGKWVLGEIEINPSTSAPVPPGDHQVYYNTGDEITYIWNGSEWIDIAKLSLVDIDPFVDTDGDHDSANDTDIYNHAITKNNDALGKMSAEQTVFKRFITIEYIKNDGSIVTSVNNSDELTPYNRMRVTSTVSWIRGKNQFKTELTTHITDYLGREGLNG